MILISEVGPRDGLQSISNIMPLEAKKAWIAAEAAAGVTEIEVGSFVPAKLLPQLADTAEVVAFARTIPGLTVAVLVPNFKGAEAAIAAGAHKITIPLSTSETHSLKNVRRTHAQMIEESRQIAELIRSLPAEQRPKFEGGTGYANPTQVKDLVKRVRAVVGEHALSGLHLHNTRGLGLANVMAGLEVGITTFDSSLGGLGGCPFAPGASGNIVTEDLVFMLEAMGLPTGIDLPKLLDVRRILKETLPNDALYGFTPDAGLPLGFQAATPSVGVRQ